MLGWKGLNLKYNKQPMKNELRMELPLILHAKHSSVAGMYTVFPSNVALWWVLKLKCIEHSGILLSSVKTH